MDEISTNARCATCRFFIPDTVGDPRYGIGNCQKYDDFKESGTDEYQLKIAFIKLGNELFLGGLYGLPRHCTKYEEQVDLKTCF